MSIPSVYVYDDTQTIGTWTQASEIIYGYDVDGIAYWQFWDTYDTGAWIWANGGWQYPATLVTSTDLSSVWFGGAIDYSTEYMWVRAIDWWGYTSDWTWVELYQTSSFGFDQAAGQSAVSDTLI